MKTLVVKTVSSALLFCGVSAFSLNVNAADVSNWSDLIDALDTSEYINIEENITANTDATTINAIYDDGGDVIWQNLYGNRYIIGGNGYIGFTVEEGAKFKIDQVLGTSASMGDSFIGFDRFLTNKGNVSVVSSNLQNNSDTTGVGGAAIYNTGIIVIDDSNFIDNVVDGRNNDITGGAIYNNSVLSISNSEFYGNEINANSGINAYGGAIYNDGGELTILDTSFYDNKVTSDTGSALGGAIYSKGSLTLISTAGKTMTFSGNKICQGTCENEVSNDIFVQNGTLNFNPTGGNIEILGGVDGNDYSIDIRGGGSVDLYSSINNVSDVYLDSSVLYISATGSIETEKFLMKNTPTVKLGVSFLEDNDGNIIGAQTGKINVSGDVSGNANIVVSTSDATIISPDRSVVFLEAPNDDLSTETNFTVTRVITSPYMWETKVENGDGVGSTWSIYMTETPNTGGEGTRVLTPEVVAYIGVPSVVMEQHRNMLLNVKDKVSSNKFPAQGKYGMREDHYRNQSGLNMWITPVYSYSDVTSPVEFETDITGIDLGFDVQGNISNKLGIFASYRRGEYEFNGNGEEYSSELSSDITDNSFMAGLYYRYDNDNFWSFSSLYAGKHSMDISVEDGAVSEEAKAFQYGANFEVGHTFVPAYNLTLDPSFGIFYTGTDIDSVKDDFGKTAKYDLMHVFEGELSLKLEKTFNQGFGYSKVYVKPSVIQSFVIGDGVKVTGLSELDGYDNQTLGRIELGGRVAIDNNLSIYGYANYTAGNDYSNASAGLGINYRFQ